MTEEDSDVRFDATVVISVMGRTVRVVLLVVVVVVVFLWLLTNEAKLSTGRPWLLAVLFMAAAGVSHLPFDLAVGCESGSDVYNSHRIHVTQYSVLGTIRTAMELPSEHYSRWHIHVGLMEACWRPGAVPAARVPGQRTRPGPTARNTSYGRQLGSSWGWYGARFARVAPTAGHHLGHQPFALCVCSARSALPCLAPTPNPTPCDDDTCPETLHALYRCTYSTTAHALDDIRRLPLDQIPHPRPRPPWQPSI